MVIAVLYVDEDDGTLWRGRTIERPRFDASPTRILIMRRKRMEVLTAPYSERREPGTWHREGPAS